MKQYDECIHCKLGWGDCIDKLDEEAKRCCWSCFHPIKAGEGDERPPEGRPGRQTQPTIL